jgi:hypothetical protein
MLSQENVYVVGWERGSSWSGDRALGIREFLGLFSQGSGTGGLRALRIRGCLWLHPSWSGSHGGPFSPFSKHTLKTQRFTGQVARGDSACNSRPATGELFGTSSRDLMTFECVLSPFCSHRARNRHAIDSNWRAEHIASGRDLTQPSFSSSSCLNGEHGPEGREPNHEQLAPIWTRIDNSRIGSGPRTNTKGPEKGAPARAGLARAALLAVGGDGIRRVRRR